MMRPWPPQRGQVRSMAKKPWDARMRPAPPQVWQVWGWGPRLGARPVAGLAGLGGRDLDLHVGAGEGLFEADLQVVAQVLAPRRTGRAPAARAEHLAKHIAEHLGEDVAGVAEPGAGAEAARAAVHPGMTEAVIGRALLGIGEHRIGLVAGLEPRLGFVVARIAVGVMLHGLLAEGGLQLDLRALAGHAEDFVIVLSHSGLGPRYTGAERSFPAEAKPPRPGLIA
jgi:hypothetical protein